MSRRWAAAALLAAAAAAAEPPLAGAWVGAKPAFPAAATVVVAILDRTGTCCGGPAAAMAGLAGLRDGLKERAGVVLVAVDATPGVTAAAATAADGEVLAGVPLIADPARASGSALGAETGVTMTYVVVRPDGGRSNCADPAAVRRELAR